MRAVIFADGDVSVQERPDPVPGAGEILVRVRAAGLNGADLLQRKGRYPAPPGSPQDIPGLEFAGEVVERGAGAERFAVGDRVMAIVGGGGQAELATIHERAVVPVPAQLPWDQAGGFPEVFSTAYDALFVQANLEMGERLLVHGAAGGVGTAAIQLARCAGVRVTGTVRHKHLHDRVETLGATAVDPEEFSRHGPFDVVLELVGAPNLPDDLKVLRTGGRIVVIGVGAGAKSEVNLLRLMGSRGRLMASTLRARPLEDKAHLARLVEQHVLPLVEAKQLSVPVHETHPAERVADAYKQFAEGGKFGKIVLMFNDR